MHRDAPPVFTRGTALRVLVREVMTDCGERRDMSESVSVVPGSDLP